MFTEEQTLQQEDRAGLGIPKPDMTGAVQEKQIEPDPRFQNKQEYEERQLQSGDKVKSRDMREPLTSLSDGFKDEPKQEDEKPQKKLTPQQEVDRAGDTLRSFMFGDDYADKPKKSEDSIGSDKQEDQREPQDETASEQGEEENPGQESGLRESSSKEFDDSSSNAMLEELKGMRDDLKKTNQPNPQQYQEQPKQPSLPPEQAEQFEVMSELEQLNPKKYEGIVEKYQDYLTRAQEYQKQWQKENPNQRFDHNDEEHQEWVAQNEPQIDSRDWANAQAELKVRRVEEKFQRELKKERFDNEVKEFQRAGITSELNDLLKEIDQDSYKVLSEKGAQGLRDADPEAYEIFNYQAEVFRDHAVELKKLMDGAGLYQFDPRNPVHSKLDQIASTVEQKLKSAPRSQQVRDGKLFATFNDLSAMPPSERGNYWTISYADVVPQLKTELSKSGKERIQTFRKKIEHYIKSRTQSGENQSKQNSAQNPQNQSQQKTQSKSPSGSVGGQFSNIDESNNDRANKGESVLFNAMFGG